MSEAGPQYLMSLDMSSKTNVKSLTRVYHLSTVPPNDISVQNCSWKWYIPERLPNERFFEGLFGGTRE